MRVQDAAQKAFFQLLLNHTWYIQLIDFVDISDILIMNLHMVMIVIIADIKLIEL